MATARHAPARGTRRGFTLVEVAAVLAVTSVLAGLAIPSVLGMVQKSRRTDALAALTRVQLAQERFHALHGLYAADTRALVGARATVSDGGLYDIRLVDVSGERYTALAAARADGAQAGDAACAQISLTVSSGGAEYGPSAACWNR